MKDKLFRDKIAICDELATLKTKITYLELEKDKLKAIEKKLDCDIANELSDNLTNAYSLDNYKFSLEREVTTTILSSKRQDALKYHNKFKIGIFAMTIQGMKLKAWVKELLSQDLPVPEFVSYEEYPKIKIEKPI